MENLASESNAAKINQRFKELEKDRQDQQKQIKVLTNEISNLRSLLNQQTSMIQKIWVQNLGSGPTVMEN